MNAVFILLLAFFAQATPSAAPRAKAEAQALLKQGTALYARGDFAAALEKFESAYRIYPSAKLQFNIGQADRDLGRPVEALRAFDSFLAAAPDAAAAIVAEARQSDAELRAKLGRVRIDSVTSGVEVTLDGSSVGKTPLGDPIWTTPGVHAVALAGPDARPVSVEVAAGAIATAALDPPAFVPPPSDAPAVLVTAPPSPPPASARAPGWWRRQRWYAWAAAGTTVALGAGAIVAGLSANAMYDDLQNSCGGHCTMAQTDPLRHRALLADVLYGLTAASAIATGITLYVGGRETGVAVAWRFP